MSEQRLISAEQAKETLEHDYAYAAAELLDEVPTIDPETLPVVRELRAKLAECKPVVHAHWETVPNRVLEHGEVAIRGTAQWCSACKHADKDFKKWMPFCPHCGAKMDEATE